MAKDYQEVSREILDRLDIRAEYEALGVEVTGRSPNSKGWIKCRAFGREDKNPSAEINVGDGRSRGQYCDWVTCERIGLWDFAAKYGGHSDWKAARRHYAHKMGVSLPRGLKAPKDPGDKIDWQEWNEALVACWLQHKPGITVESFRKAGGRLGMWPKKGKTKHAIAALPIYNHNLTDDPPTGWVMWNRNGKSLPVFHGPGEKPTWIKMKNAAGSKAGWMGMFGLAKLEDADVVWKTEGPPDMLALQSIIPESLQDKHVVITNSNGCGEIPREEYIKHLAGKTVYVLHDADKPGQGIPLKDEDKHRVMAARLWCQEISRHASECRNVQLNYEIADDHGKDVRDFVNEGGTYEELLELAASAEIVSPPRIPDESSEDPGGEDPGDSGADHDDRVLQDEQCCEDVGLDVLGESDTGRVTVFSIFHRKLVVIQDVNKMSYERLLQICGPVAREKVNMAEEYVPGTYSLRRIKEAISVLAGYRRLRGDSIVGLGCWRGKTLRGEESQSVILVGAGEAARLNGGTELRQVRTPRADGLLMDLSHSQPWYDLPKLNEYMAKSKDKDWTRAAVIETEKLFRRWKWRHQETDPMTVTGLVLASWVQTLWRFRPMVAVVGSSNTGKSMLCEALGGNESGDLGLFGNLALLSSQSTEAGIRQHLKTDAAVLICDEFEDSKERAKILNLLRTSSRGSRKLMGTADQHGSEYGLRHIAWVAAIEVGLRREPDRNRFIILELVPPPSEMWGKLVLPGSDWMVDHGQKLLAISLANIREASRLAVMLKTTAVEGVDKRVIESYAVPAAMLSTCMGHDDEIAKANLVEILECVDRAEQGAGDADDLVDAILAATVDCGKGERLSVSQILRELLGGGNSMNPTKDKGHREMALEGHGVALVPAEQGRPGGECEVAFFVDHRVVCVKLLRGTEWERQSIDQILKRLPGGRSRRCRLADRRARGVSVPIRLLQEKYLSDDGRESTGLWDDSIGAEF